MSYLSKNYEMKNMALLVCMVLFCSATKPLSKVLIIGDSISLGYTPYVIKDLTDKAVVSHSPGNSESTTTGIKKIESWLGDQHWDLIIFNWGLWDLCYRSSGSKVTGKRDKISGKLSTTLDDYRKNLEFLVQRLQKASPHLIFVTTTFVPPNEEGRFAGDEDKYNAVAREVMKKYNVQINDLNKLSHKVHPKFGMGSDNVHYNASGYERLSKQITASIKKQLKIK